jgi:hypothetical protein
MIMRSDLVPRTHSFAAMTVVCLVLDWASWPRSAGAR